MRWTDALMSVKKKEEIKKDHSSQNAPNITNWWCLTNIKSIPWSISLLRQMQSKLSHSSLPLSTLFVHLYVQLLHSECVRGIEQDSCQTLPPWVKMAGEVLSLSFSLSLSLSFFFFSHWVHNGNLPALASPQVLWCYFMRTKEGASSLLYSRLGSGWLTLLPRSGMTMKGPPTPTVLPMAFTFPCLCVIISHMLYFLSLLTYVDPILL